MGIITDKPSKSSVIGGLRFKALIKSFFSGLVFHTGLIRVLFKAVRKLDKRKRLFVLTYHKILPDNEANKHGGIGLARFQEQVEAIKSIFTVVSPEAGMSSLAHKGNDSIGGNDGVYPLLFTFDDGYLNNLDYAAPILKKANLTGVFFVTTGELGTDRFLWPDEVVERILATPNGPFTMAMPDGTEKSYCLSDHHSRLEVAFTLKRWLKGLSYREFTHSLEQLRQRTGGSTLIHHDGTRLLNWDGVRRLVQLGMHVGSHSSRHLILSRLPDDDLSWDLAASQEALRHNLGADSKFIAYPNGHRDDFDFRVVNNARGTGFAYGFTMEPGIASEDDDPMMLPRVAPGNDSGAVIAFELLVMAIREIWGARRREKTQDQAGNVTFLPAPAPVTSPALYVKRDVPMVPSGLTHMEGGGEGAVSHNGQQDMDYSLLSGEIRKSHIQVDEGMNNSMDPLTSAQSSEPRQEPAIQQSQPTKLSS